MASTSEVTNDVTRPSHDGFRQAMLKTALETIPQLTEENYSIWKDKMTALLKLRGVLNSLNNLHIPLGESDNAELTMLLLAKIDSVTHNNVVTSDNSESAQKLWQSIKDRFASSQSSNRARMFNDFLYVKFQEDAVETFVTNIKVSIKKLVDVGIDLPQDILAYLVLFKFPNSLQNLKRQIMHSDKDLNVEFVCNHLIQFNNESRAELAESSKTTPEAALFSNKGKSAKQQGSSANQPNSSRRCRSGYHNPKQDENHKSDNCWHLHPEKAPEWWRDSQAQWKATKEKEKENYFMSLLTLWIESGDPKSRIFLDSGASAHIFNDVRFFEKLELGNFDVIKTGKQGATMPIKGKGVVRLTWGKKSITLNDCLYVPSIVINLISAGELDAKGCCLNAKNSTFAVSKHGQIALKGNISNGLFSVKNPDSVGAKTQPLANVSSSMTTSLQEMHEKHGHASLQRLQPLLGDSFSKAEINSFECKSCVLSKITKQPFKISSKLATKPFERIHLDLIGPIKPESSLKHQFILTVVDNHSGYLAGFPLIHKDDTTDTLINILESEYQKRGYYPSLICSDGGGEFVGHRLVRFLNEKHIGRLISEPYHPEHNGRAERANRTIVESMRATIYSAKIQKRFWHEVLKSCCLSLNQIPRNGQDLPPWEIIHGKPFPQDFLRSLGTPAIVLRSNGTKGRKFDLKGEEGLLIGFNVALRSYRIITQHGRVLESKHVRFLQKKDAEEITDWEDQLEFEPASAKETEIASGTEEESMSRDHRENDSDREHSNDSIEEEEDVERQLLGEETTSTQNPTPQTQTQAPITRILRDRSQIKPPTRYGFHHYYEPNTFDH
ncbi:hypothetical protein VP01_2923g1 [Puccinia sorghi]|uniref:Integrase catalytic domain-containing protein n=1 Tax=Puccinia sorghi TaxID=27349 RepID=A0A0L6V1B3_9BASI|nr:hypothetical protein VP01_2923g1 [Puccinia sorghi]